MSETQLAIGEAASRAGVAASTLRYWENEGLLAAPGRIGGKRRYGSEALRQIEMIALAKRSGFSLAEIRILLAGFSVQKPPPQIWQRLASRKLPEIEQTLVQAETMQKILEAGLRCECLSLEDCIEQNSAGSTQNV